MQWRKRWLLWLLWSVYLLRCQHGLGWDESEPKNEVMVRLLWEIRHYFRCIKPIIIPWFCKLNLQLNFVENALAKNWKGLLQLTFFFMIVIINKRMDSFQVLKMSAFTKWRDKKRLKRQRTISTQHHTVKRGNSGFRWVSVKRGVGVYLFWKNARFGLVFTLPLWTLTLKQHLKKNRPRSQPRVLLTALSATPPNTQKIWLFVIAVLKTPLPKACQFTREATSNYMNKRPHVSLTSRKSTVEMSCHTSSLVGSFSSILTLPGDEDVFTGLGEIFRFGFWVPGLLVVRVYSLGSGSGPDEIHIQLSLWLPVRI